MNKKTEGSVSMSKYDYSLLEKRMREKNMSQAALAEAISMSRTTLNIKLNNHSSFTQKEIKAISAILSIPDAEISTYFFMEYVQKTVLGG